MSTISKNDFIAGIKKSDVIDKEKLEEFLKVVEGKSTQDIVAKLVRDQLLTKWQAKYLMSGRTRLDIGSYQLLERIQQDELGDRFLALHMSLARKVDLRVLPTTLVHDKNRCDEFMQKASLAAKLDHPNLIQVYDIDREGGRLFLVTEHVEGTSLDRIATSKLSEAKIARFASHVIAGIRHAHDNSVIHGCITQSDLVLTAEDEIKIQNLSVSPLRQIQGEAGIEPTVSDDYEAISKINICLLNKIPDSKRSSDFDTLAGIFGGFKASEPESIDAISKSLRGLLESKFGLTGINGTELAPNEPVAGGFDQPIASTSVPKKKNPPKEEEEQPPELEAKRGAIGRLWNENPVALIATAAVIAILVFGGSGWGALSLLNNSGGAVGKDESSATDDGTDSSKKKDATDNPSGENSKNRSKRILPLRSDGELKQPNFGDVAGMENQIANLPTESTLPPNSQAKTEPDVAEPEKNEPNIAPAANFPDTTAFAAPKAKMQFELGPDKHIVPANTPLKVVQQATNGYAEVEATMADNTVLKGSIKVDLIVDSAVGAVPSQPPAVTDPIPGNKVPIEGSPKGNAVVPPANVNPENKEPAPEAMPNNPPVAPVPDVLTKISGIGKATQPVLYKLGITTFKQLAAISPEELKAKLTTVGFLRSDQNHASWIAQAKLLSGDNSPDPAPPNPADPVPANTTGPFVNFPRITDLPPADDTKEIKIADLLIKKQHLLGAEIISEQAVSRTRMMFDLRRATDDNQKWVVGVKRRPNEKPTDIAHFRKSDDAFHFQWLPEAEKNKYANFLRNCYLKLNLPGDQSTFLTLRSPVKMPDLRLTEKSLTNTIEIELPWLPDPDNIVIEVLPLRVPGVATSVAKSGIEKGMPGRVWLKRQDKTGFLWIQVGADLRSNSKLKVQSNLILLAPTGQTKPVKSMQDLADFETSIKQNEIRAVTLNQQAQARIAPAGKKGEYDQAKLAYQKKANEAIAMSAKVVEYGEVLPKILNQPVSIRVYAKLGKFQTILAVTDSTLNEKE